MSTYCFHICKETQKTKLKRNQKVKWKRSAKILGKQSELDFSADHKFNFACSKEKYHKIAQKLQKFTWINHMLFAQFS